jgi:hypothetical protein
LSLTTSKDVIFGEVELGRHQTLDEALLVPHVHLTGSLIARVVNVHHLAHLELLCAKGWPLHQHWNQNLVAGLEIDEHRMASMIPLG